MKRKSAVFTVCLILLLVLCACQKEGAEPGATVPDDTVEVVDDAAAMESADPEEAEPENTEPEQNLAEDAGEMSASGEEASGEEETASPADPGTAVAPETESGQSGEDTTSALKGHSEQAEAYFENAVFIGDSIMEGIRRYVAKCRGEEPTFSNAQFLTSTVGVSVANLVGGEKNGPYYRYSGENQYLLQILPQMACSRIFLQLGLNDMAEKDPVVATSIEQYGQLIDLLQAAVPGAEIIVITNPPKVASSWLPSYTPNRNFGNALIQEFVDELIRMCEDKGVPYVDVHAALCNEDGVLPEEYCNDGFVHLSEAGAAVVVEELYRFAAERNG